MNQDTSSQSQIAQVTNRCSKVIIGPRKVREPTKPQIQLVKKGDSVESIKIVCSCGEEIIINCIYPDAS
jgi:hypothetical protein